jgi:hypothetical protein
MYEYICLKVISKSNEQAPSFSQRLSTFWTQMLREDPDAFEMVYAEKSEFESEGDRLYREYAITSEIAIKLGKSLQKSGFEHSPIDLEDLYSKYEIVEPEWMQIEH